MRFLMTVSNLILVDLFSSNNFVMITIIPLTFGGGGNKSVSPLPNRKENSKGFKCIHSLMAVNRLSGIGLFLEVTY